MYGKPDTCAFTVDCTCGLKVNYADHMIRDLLLNGIADNEIRREILRSADVLTRVVNKIVTLVESKEMTGNAVFLTEVTSASAIKRPDDADHRARRNAIHQFTCSGQNNRVARSASDFFSSTKKGLVVEIPNLIPCLLNATGHRNTEDVTSLLKWTLHHLNQAYKLLKSRCLRTLS